MDAVAESKELEWISYECTRLSIDDVKSERADVKRDSRTRLVRLKCSGANRDRRNFFFLFSRPQGSLVIARNRSSKQKLMPLCIQYRPAGNNICHKKLRLNLLDPTRNWPQEIGLIRCIHLVFMFEFIMAYTSRCRPG